MNRVKTRAQSKSANDQILCKLYGITHEIQIKLVKLKLQPLPFATLYKCHVCLRIMKRFDQYRVHLQTHLKKTIFCSVQNCKYKCSIPKYLENHVRRSHVPKTLKPFECKFCKWRTHCAQSLKGHTKVLHNPDIKRFNCAECNFTTAKSAMLSAHVFKRHGGQKPVQCSDCAFRTVNKCTLALHWKSIHQDQAKRARPFKCEEPECSYAGHTAHMLKLHIRTHTGEKPFKCQFCPYASTQRCHLKEHLRRHTNEKPYACTLCPYKCTTKCILDCHMRSHTGKRPFACTKCKYRTTQRRHLNKHFRRHHTPQGKIKNHKCPFCQNKFYRQSTLESHMTRHTGERHFKCRFCGSSLTQSSSRNMHEKRCLKRSYASD